MGSGLESFGDCSPPGKPDIGCVEKTLPECRKANFGFNNKIGSIGGDSYRFGNNYNMSLTECEDKCMQNYSCVAYASITKMELKLRAKDPSRRKLINWTKHKNIIGVAQGLLYLHKYSRLKVIYRDLKPSNILLDHDLNPKISDFGLARIPGVQQSEANTNRIVEKYDYMAPQYAVEGILSMTIDIQFWSFTA
ncbi:G-type lectin S-receptor-like serine threonine-kinase CES101 isoform X1 [Olea europaea subsp. europaea]|uniref:non-specific serine/threonine protein kinase n=1 Tax=Olea europaea subsp. europaea TaxID=158383 RepID=A0A8S0S4K3_OLEEU|nr:G-type lectin S-receptor-like serine threonine-kinase CES101 isoform X1 [Olea europaea subsp. europaea]